MPGNGNLNFPALGTLGAIRGLVAFECDQPTPIPSAVGTLSNFNQSNVQFDMYNSIINRSYKEMVAILSQAFEDFVVSAVKYPTLSGQGNNGVIDPTLLAMNSQFQSQPTFTTNGQDWLYPLPDDFSRMTGLDLLMQANNVESAVTIRPYMNNERNMYNGPNPWVTGQWEWCRYRLTGGMIELIPRIPPAGMNFLLRYVPIPQPLVDQGVITLHNLVVGDLITIQTSLNPQNPAPYQAVSVVTNPNMFLIGANDTITAANLAANINATLPWLDGSPSTLQDQQMAYATSSGNQVFLNLVDNISVSWSSSTGNGPNPPDYCPRFALDPTPQPFSQQGPPFWSNTSINLLGYDEYVIVDAAIKIMGRQQQDTSLLQARKEALLARIKSERMNRDAGFPKRITNTRRLRQRGGVNGLGNYGW